MIQIKKELLIQFINFANECCGVMDDDYVAEWLLTKNSNLNMERPIDLFSEEAGREKLFRILFFIEIGEADLI